MDDDFIDKIGSYIDIWHGVKLPNDPARRLAMDLGKLIAGFEVQRNRLRFEDEPSSFEAALRDLKE